MNTRFGELASRGRARAAVATSANVHPSFTLQLRVRTTEAGFPVWAMRDDALMRSVARERASG